MTLRKCPERYVTLPDFGSEEEVNPLPRVNNVKSEKVVRQFLYWVLFSLLLFGLAANYNVITDHNGFSTLAKVLGLLSIASALIVIVLSLSTKRLLPVGYIGGAIIVNITAFSVYLWTISFLIPVTFVTKSLFLLAFILVELLLVVKRLFFMTSNFVLSVKEGTHGKYIQRDLLFSITLSAMIIAIGKLTDIHPSGIFSQSLQSLFTCFGGWILSMIGIEVFVIGIAKYRFSVKPRNLRPEKNTE